MLQTKPYNEETLYQACLSVNEQEQEKALAFIWQRSYIRALKLYRMYAPNLVETHDCAEDIASEVARSVWEKVWDLREPKAFYGWMNKIIVNKVVDDLKRRGRETTVTQITRNWGREEADPLLSADDIDRVSVAEKAVENISITGLVQYIAEHRGLSGDSKQVVLRILWEDRTPEEVASFMARTRNNIDVIKHRDLRRLRRDQKLRDIRRGDRP